MARYIDTEKFAERIRLSPAFSNCGIEGELLQKVVLDLLNNAPAADVVEVKRGYWIKTDRGICPYCGAKMDGKEIENDKS